MSFPILLPATVIRRTLFWVGGSASWNGTPTQKWSYSSGGAGGAPEPTINDDVIINAASGAVTVTIATNTANCYSLNFTGFTGTWAGSTAINISGSFTLGAGMTRTYTGAITFNGNRANQVIKYNGKTTASAIVINGTGAWQNFDAMNNGSSAITVTSGSWDTNGQTITFGTLTSTGTATRAISLGASTLNGAGFNVTNTGLTFTAGTSTINITGATFTASGLTFNVVNFTSTALSLNTIEGAIFSTFTHIPATDGTMSIGSNFTVNSQFTVMGADTSVNRTVVRSVITATTPAAQKTITVNGAYTITNATFQDVNIAGTSAPISGTSVANAGKVTGVTFTPAVTRYWVHPGTASQAFTASNWASVSGGATGETIPIPGDAAIFDELSFGASGKTVTVTNAFYLPSINFTNATNSPTFTVTTAARITGDFKLISGMTCATFSPTIGSVNATFMSGGKSFVTIASFLSGVLTLGDNNTTTTAFQVNSGSISDGGFSITTPTLTDNVNSTFSNAIISSSLSTTSLATAFNFVNLTVSNASGLVTFQTIVNINITGVFTVTGADNSAGRITIVGTNAQRTINSASNAFTNCNFRYINGTGAGIWAGTSIGNVGGNTGITFTPAVTRYWVHPAGASAVWTDSNWASISGGATGSSMPLPQDTAVFDGLSFSAGSKTVTSLNGQYFSAINASAVTNSPTFNFALSFLFCGNVTFGSSMIWSAAACSFVGNTILTTAGKTFGAITCNVPLVKLTLADALTDSSTVTLLGGELDLAGFTTTTTVLTTSTDTRARTLTFGTATLVLTSNGSGNVFDTGNTPALLTVNKGTGTIKISNSSTNLNNFVGGGLNYYNYWNARTGVGARTSHTNSDTFAGDFKIDPGNIEQFTVGTTTTVSTLHAVGNATALIQMGNVDGATPGIWNLVITGGTVSTVDYVTFQNCNVTGATFYAGANSKDGGGNTGITFSAAP